MTTHRINPGPAVARMQRRLDRLAIDQLRAEVARLAEENEALREQLESAYDAASMQWQMRAVADERADQILCELRRAGLSLRIPVIGMTRDGQVGLIASAAQ